ncbi:hypothetical protein [Paraburkholderia phenoliruptrix]|uniref:hypothetical protein n=1 Tax=Paraburkholderia phenoliruptrix TaxID=252970 RepID=UPI001C4FAB90|nr:hypothetical protein [Paraburkholderia phenoliruptrix]MBW0450860.1 hypothetical protein [Paraburkholderia phenoliruptrix]MBW9100953.1 hypothetical protein [Paraburkholderia phenoliruptrix]
MILQVMIPDGIGYHKRRHGMGVITTCQRYRPITTTVYKLIGPPRRIDCDLPTIYVHAWIPEHHRGGIAANDPGWVEEGVFVCRAVVKDNRHTLAPFLASGVHELDVREMA